MVLKRRFCLEYCNESINEIGQGHEKGYECLDGPVDVKCEFCFRPGELGGGLLWFGHFGCSSCASGRCDADVRFSWVERGNRKLLQFSGIFEGWWSGVVVLKGCMRLGKGRRIQ